MTGATQGLQPQAMNLFPVMGSLREVHEWAESQLPITSKNQLVAILAVHHNTILKQIQQ